jgi:hypothetical protein
MTGPQVIVTPVYLKTLKVQSAYLTAPGVYLRMLLAVTVELVPIVIINKFKLALHKVPVPKIAAFVNRLAQVAPPKIILAS